MKFDDCQCLHDLLLNLQVKMLSKAKSNTNKIKNLQTLIMMLKNKILLSMQMFLLS